MPRLQYFNEALVDHYSPEKPTAAVLEPEKWFGIREFIHSFKQKKEFKRALIYAETKLLKFFQIPMLRARLDGNHIENWLKELHKIGAKTILRDWSLESGHYISEPIIRWEKRAEFSTAFEMTLFNYANYKLKRNVLIKQLFNEYGLSECCAEWLQIIKNIEQRKYRIPRGFVPANANAPARIIYSLAYARKNNLLSASQNKAVDTVCKIVLPDTIPDQMQTYCSTLAEKIRNCDGNLDNVIQLAALAFRDLTQIHPFPNANGRISTIILNLILVGFGQPSIVLRTHEDLEQESSEYNHVVSTMDDDLSPLTNYIKRKVLQNKVRPDRGTLQSSPACDDPSYLLSDALFALAKEFKQTLTPPELDPPSLPQHNISKNLLLKRRLNETGRRFGCDVMYMPGFVKYSDEEMVQIRRGRMEL